MRKIILSLLFLSLAHGNSSAGKPAGLESDYATLLRENSLMTFGGESREVLWVEYFMRKLSLIGYYAWGLFKADIGIKEEADELRRDIVGHDIYGAVRHIHRPEAEYQRYVDYGELTSTERKYVKRVGLLSLLNLADPTLFTKFGFTLRNGDRERWFPALGAVFSDIHLGGRFVLTAAHGWQQPENLSFTSTDGRFGGALDVMCKFRLDRDVSHGFGISSDLGMTAKTDGFLLEYMSMERHVGMRFGTSLWF